MAGWFEDARFGMFVHWDHASSQGLELSWPMVGGLFALPKCQDVSVAEYQQSASTFSPIAFDPRALAALARRAGMRYAVFTAKHHAGYAMWPTRLCDHSVAAAGRDLVREWVDAVRAEGLRVGLYCSLSDWHHPDYPAFTDDDRPYRPGVSPPLPSPEPRDRYLAFLQGQLRELLHRLRDRRPAVVRRRLGAPGRVVGARRARVAHPRLAARDRHQRPAARRR